MSDTASSWRIFNHDDFVFGASQKTLEMSFNSWLYPIIEYGCPVWIFRIKDCFHYSSPVVDPYVSVFHRLETQYHQFAKAILGVPTSTSNVATLVRLGWMPLDYRLAFRACIWYMKIRLGLAGASLDRQLAVLSDPANDEMWSRTCFYKPAHDLILRLDRRLLKMSSIHRFTDRLRACFFDELSRCWSDCTHARICHVIHPRWESISWGRLSISRRASCFYQQVAVGRGSFNDRINYSNRRGDTSCRFGFDTIETVQHVFFDCAHCSNARDDLTLICREKNLVYSLTNLFTHRSLRCRVELFLDWFFAIFSPL